MTGNAGTLAIESTTAICITWTHGPVRLVMAVARGWKHRRSTSSSGIVLGNFDVVDRGIYYIDRSAADAGAFASDRPGGETRLRYFDFDTQQSTTVAAGLGTIRFGLSATRDGRTVIYSRVDTSIDELMVVDDFR